MFYKPRCALTLLLDALPSPICDTTTAVKCFLGFFPPLFALSMVWIFMLFGSQMPYGAVLLEEPHCEVHQKAKSILLLQWDSGKVVGFDKRAKGDLIRVESE